MGRPPTLAKEISARSRPWYDYGGYISGHRSRRVSITSFDDGKALKTENINSSVIQQAMNDRNGSKHP